MQILRKTAYARAGLIGNPSDGYFGKTIAVIVPRFRADVVLYEWPALEILWSQEDQGAFGSLRELTRDVELHGYYGGVRLVKATIKRFVDYCDGRKYRRRSISQVDNFCNVKIKEPCAKCIGFFFVAFDCERSNCIVQSIIFVP